MTQTGSNWVPIGMVVFGISKRTSIRISVMDVINFREMELVL